MAEDNPPGDGWSFPTLLRHVDARFAGSDRYNSTLVAELEKRILALLAEKSLRDEQRFQAQEGATSTAFKRADEALVEAKNASNLGFQKSNEWQATFRDLSSTYMPRTEFSSENRTMQISLASLSDRVGKIEGTTGGIAQSWGVIVSVVSILVSLGALLSVVLFHK